MRSVEHRQNGTTDSSYKRSPNIWADCPIPDIREGVAAGYHRRWNFADFKLATNVNAAQAYWASGLSVFGSDGFAIAAVDAQGGGVTIGSDGDNEGGAIRQAIQPFQISRSYKKLWFEARLKTSTITDTKHGIFLGLCDSTAATATVPIAAAGTLADLNFVGFHRLEGDGDQFDTVYKADGVTQVSLQTDAVTIAADTYVKLGFVYDPLGDQAGANYLSFYANNQRLSTGYQVVSAAGTDFPNDVRLGIILSVLNATASTPGTTAVQWIEVAQLF